VPHPKLALVRQRYGFCCGYCGVAEVDTGAELTVDHYRPVAAGGDDSDDNLVYACIRCNQCKGDSWPTADDLQHGRRALHPQRDSVAAHMREAEETGQLHALTETGRFHITLLRLNRPALVEHRKRRRLAAMLAERLEVLAAENEHLRTSIAAQEAYIAELRRRLAAEAADQSEQ
jgi:hypothetical protein